ncbi:hypothetical protein BJ085DRAFT_30038 [Dimargaris cristalligena]|uniref:tRNA(Ile)-lysidine synthetase n=1 Tax=Dimargaris cristalligena TaxID=215637 RepID=A0A4P9ZYH4_9FUNG|nr:hypothetical protein BJ085DRAFT_30038 [Dimargaris cristalligena]|eukprot:RKP38428.1 hypothetical protein BJ085DRAFT_30038 [Dimargaris cristalligena]
MALLALLRQSLPKARIVALTVDHQFRPESSEEAEKVKQMATDLGADHYTLTIPWNKPDATGGTARLGEDKAKDDRPGCPEGQAMSTPPSQGPLDLPAPNRMEEVGRHERYRLMGQACSNHGLPVLFTGHHLNDQLETTFTRFIKQSGIDGIAGISALRLFPEAFYMNSSDFRLARPLLGFSKQRILDTCKVHNIHWVEDPSNQSTIFQRNAIRQIIQEETGKSRKDSDGEMSPLSELSLGSLNLRMQEHRENVESHAIMHGLRLTLLPRQTISQILQDYVTFRADIGVAVVRIPYKNQYHPSDHPEVEKWWHNPSLATRTYSALCNWVCPTPHSPRRKQLEGLYEMIKQVSQTDQPEMWTPGRPKDRLRGYPQSKTPPNTDKETINTNWVMGRTLVSRFEPARDVLRKELRKSQSLGNTDPMRRTRRGKDQASSPIGDPDSYMYWIFSRQPFSRSEWGETRRPIQVQWEEPPGQELLWTKRFYFRISLNPAGVSMADPATILTKLPRFYVREFTQTDQAELRQHLQFFAYRPPYWDTRRRNLIKNGREQEAIKPAFQVLNELKRIPVTTRAALPVVCVEHEGKEVIVWLPTHNLYRKQPFMDLLNFRVDFARTALPANSRWKFRTSKSSDAQLGW